MARVGEVERDAAVLDGLPAGDGGLGLLVGAFPQGSGVAQVTNLGSWQQSVDVDTFLKLVRMGQSNVRLCPATTSRMKVASTILQRRHSNARPETTYQPE